MYIRRTQDMAALIKDRRRSHGLTQAQLAAKIGVQRSTIIDLEGGARGPRLDIVMSALAALGVTLQADVGEGPVQQDKNSPDNPNDITKLVDDMMDEL